jgi:hypothetical protein
MARSQAEDEGITHQMWRVAVDIMNKHSWEADKAEGLMRESRIIKKSRSKFPY